MLTRRGSDIAFECDDCGTDMDTETDNWGDAVKAMKDEGWVAKKFGKDWCHYCDVCRDSIA